jgi:hypothetical protein
MKVLEASGDTPMAMAARLHEEAARGRTCCEEHARADAALPVASPACGRLSFPSCLRVFVQLVLQHL